MARSIWKGPFVDGYLLQKAEKSRSSGRNEIIKTWSRRSTIMQLLTAVSPQLEAIKKEGEAGRKKINQYTRYGTVVLAAFQAYGIAVGLEGMPPMHILNAPTKLMRELGYGDGYQYDHDAEEGFSGQSCFPDDMARQSFYAPVERGFEREIRKRLDYWAKLRDQRSG